MIQSILSLQKFLMDSSGIHPMYGLPIIGFCMKYYLIKKHFNLLNNGYQQFIAVGKSRASFMRNTETTNWE